MSKKNSSLQETYKDIVNKTLENCTACGTCLESCPVFPMTSIKENENIMEAVLDFLKNGTYSEDVYIKAYSCAGCGFCSDSCPQDLDPLLIHEALKVELVEHGIKPPEAFDFVKPGQKFNIHGILSALQTKPSDRRWFNRVPEQPEKAENIVFLGCFGSALPHNIYAFLDILEKMGIDFITLSGGELCCGTTLCPGAGKVKESEEKARELVASLKTLSPKRLILTCTGCFRQITEIFPTYLDMDFEVKYYTQFLGENLDKIKFTVPIEKTVKLYESCTTRRMNISGSVKKILQAIPGLQLMEDSNNDKFHCCGGVASTTYPQIAQNLCQILVQELLKTKADHITTTCPFCRLTFYPSAMQQTFDVKDIATLINLSMGGDEYEDKLEQLWKCKTVDEIINKSKENIEANGYTEQEMRNVIPLLFPFAAK